MEEQLYNMCKSRNGFPVSLLKDWDSTCKGIKKEFEKKRFEDMTNTEVAEYIAEELEINNSKARDSKINIIKKALMDLKRDEHRTTSRESVELSGNYTSQ